MNVKKSSTGLEKSLMRRIWQEIQREFFLTELSYYFIDILTSPISLIQLIRFCLWAKALYH